MEGYIQPHTIDPTRSDRIEELGETDSVQNVNVRILVGPTGRTRWDRCARAREKLHLGETDRIKSVRPISTIYQTEGWSRKLGVTDCTSR